ncbi:hypothetical protein E2C01_036236 [Portunus trituberculatus]|uniref:Uncharacterized protein n=1 Tax=Portunus trituberculatus TaxID=210409 RepID=A0A5B7F867_PORTR|nr:hypothetical protein [Portunus trituberculatus]
MAGYLPPGRHFRAGHGGVIAVAAGSTTSILGRAIAITITTAPRHTPRPAPRHASCGALFRDELRDHHSRP